VFVSEPSPQLSFVRSTLICRSSPQCLLIRLLPPPNPWRSERRWGLRAARTRTRRPWGFRRPFMHTSKRRVPALAPRDWHFWYYLIPSGLTSFFCRAPWIQIPQVPPFSLDCSRPASTCHKGICEFGPLPCISSFVFPSFSVHSFDPFPSSPFSRLRTRLSLALAVCSGRSLPLSVMLFSPPLSRSTTIKVSFLGRTFYQKRLRPLPPLRGRFSAGSREAEAFGVASGARNFSLSIYFFLETALRTTCVIPPAFCVACPHEHPHPDSD